MFTGIIEKKFEILAIKGGRFTIKHDFGDNLKIGQSIAHDGACMTIETCNEQEYTFFVMKESLNKTNFGNKEVGDYFNIERCLEVGSRIDGHFVSGHVDCVGKLESCEEVGDGSVILAFSYPGAHSKNIIDKGSISINGVSLTIVGNQKGACSVSIIPHTWEQTNLGNLKVGDAVNLEFDMLGKYILNSQS